MLEHLIPTVAALLVTGGMAALLLRDLESREQMIGWASFAAHWVSAFALYWLMLGYYDGVGDVLTFFRHGEMIDAYLSSGAVGTWRDVIDLILQREAHFPFAMRGIGRSTGTMNGLAGILIHVLGSKWTAGGVMAFFSFTGKLALYRFFRLELTAGVRTRAMIATLMMPSVVFWTSGLVKEAVATTGLGWAMFGLGRLRRAGWRSPAWGVLLVGGLLAVSLSKTYLLVPLGVAAAVWITWRPVAEGTKPSIWRWVAGLGLAFLAVVLIGQFVPRFSLAQVGDEIASMQARGADAGGGSYIEVGNPGSRSLAQQLLFAPLGLVSVLMRPFLFEVSGFAMGVSGLETTVLVVLLGRLVWRHSPAGVWMTIRSHGPLMFCVGFVLIAGVGVGLSTTNLGTLSRYRVPLMPFYVLALLVTDWLLSHRRLASAPAQRPAPVVMRRGKPWVRPTVPRS